MAQRKSAPRIGCVTSATQKFQLKMEEKFGKVKERESVPMVFTIDPLAARNEKFLVSGSGLNEIGRIERLDPVSTKKRIEFEVNEEELTATRKSPSDGDVPSISAAKSDGIKCFFPY